MLPEGRMTVTPVLTAPLPFPFTTVKCPTLTPSMSVMALLVPGSRVPILIPSSLILFLGAWMGGTSFEESDKIPLAKFLDGNREKPNNVLSIKVRLFIFHLLHRQ